MTLLWYGTSWSFRLCLQPGLCYCHRRNGELIRGGSAVLPVLSSKDWRDVDWAISMNVDFLSISFVRTADVIQNLR